MTQRYHIWTEGCQMNVADSAKLAAGLDRFGWLTADAPETADPLVLHTRRVRARPEQRAVSHRGRMKALKRRGAVADRGVRDRPTRPTWPGLHAFPPYVDHFARP